MWVISNYRQVVSFGISLLFGIVFCIIYDFLRAYRKFYSPGAVKVFFQDIFYSLVMSVLTFVLMLACSAGEIRGYLLCGIALGFLVMNFTLSRYLQKFLLCVLGVLKKFKMGITRLLGRLFTLLNAKFAKMGAFFKKISQKMHKSAKKFLKRA